MRLQTFLCCLGLLFATAAVGCESVKPVPERIETALEDQLAASLQTRGSTAAVIVNLRVDAAVGREARRKAVAQAQDAVVSANIAGFALGRRYHHVPALAGRADAHALAQLRAHAQVVSVQRDETGGGQLKEAVPAIGGDKARTNFGVTGKGIRVAVLDTGVDTDHPDLKDSVVEQHCFTQRACPPSFTAEGTSAEDDQGHGSNVTGVIASNGVVSSAGFAPDVELVVVKVNDSRNSGQESDWVAGLDWIYDNLSTLRVQVVNLSLGTSATHPDSATGCDARHTALAAAVDNLVADNVVVFAASGNRGLASDMPAPACLSSVITVGATYDSSMGKQPPMANTYFDRFGAAFGRCSDQTTAFDQITCFTNSNSMLDLVAPGAPIISDSLRGRTELYYGTSQACPVAAGVAALMLQCDPELTPARIKATMVGTGVKVTDPKNNMSFPSLRALASVQAVCGDGSEPVGSTDAGSTEPSDAGKPVTGESDATVGRTDAGRPSTPAKRDAGKPVREEDDEAQGDSADSDDEPAPTEEDEGEDDEAGGVGLGSPDDSCACTAAGFPRNRSLGGAWLLGSTLLLTLRVRRSRRRSA